jgi:hypothetical protein
MLKNRLDVSDKEWAIRYHNDCLSEFGNGPAIEIFEGKNREKSTSNNLGDTYEMPPGCNKE